MEWLLMMAAAFIGGIFIGRSSVQYPPEQVMLERIKRLRTERRIREEVDGEVETEATP